MRRAGDTTLTLAVGIVFGLLIGYVLSFTHGTPTADNASPPPEAFDYPLGILVGLGIAIVGRVVGWPLWHARRRRRAARR